ncbi:magnesium transporter [Roseomonas alkaliterrae]|uniref:Magnesium transporter MgtE n=1 Tax=Neoroseomonas alkaliterrae TaxID=1452450 RepID=A0A840Y208_9PROT|nr:magnesium transporter [Neoroseomonas alkaliterrae]MBB5690407.1 magnesium transporter [Neoroseomonas alkaliterrae]MBR0677494.1 magnesium transporter [Neoroseomonas alkaliterrae]
MTTATLPPRAALPPEAATSLHPADLAALLDRREAGDAWAVLKALPIARQAETFGYLAAGTQTAIAGIAAPRDVAALLSAMDADERADVWGRLPESLQESLAPALAAAEREDIRRLAAYPPGTAGAVMTSEYAVLRPEQTAREALDSLRGQAASKETIAIAYVLSPQRRLLGTVALEDLVLAAPERSVASIMRPEPAFVRVEDSAEEAARLLARYDLPAIPVVNGGEAMVGILTADDAMDVAEAEATTDFHKAGGSASLGVPLREATIGLLYRKRIAWLVVLVFANVFSGAGIAAFEDVIAANVALVFFLPLLIDSGGNAGSQSATLMVRALATGEARIGDWARMMRREILVAAMLGGTMALAVSLLGLIRGGPEIALVVAMTMVLVVVAGSVIGLSLPFVLTRMRLDPATASAPLITSIADATGVLIYFAIASALLVP